MLEVIDEIISSYPVTYINLERIRAKVDEADELFWIIDNENRYLLANKKYAANLGLLPSQVEGKNIESFIPAYLINFNKALDNYIKDSRNTFIVEGFPVSGLPVSESFQVIQIPIVNSEGSVIATICVAQKIELKSEIKPEETGTKEAIDVAGDKRYGSINDESEILNKLIKNNPEPSFIYDKENLKFLHVNKSALSLYGYSNDEFLKLDLTDLYAPEDIQSILDSAGDKSKEGLFSPPYCHKKKDGSSVYVEISRIGIVYNQKQACFNIIRNVTEKLNLAKESQQFKALFENSEELLFVTDKDGFIQSVNRTVVEVLGYSARSLQETSFASLVNEEDRGKINSAIFQKGVKEKISHKTRLKKAGNEQIDVELIFIPVFNFREEVDSYSIFAKIERVKEIVKEVPIKVSDEKFVEGTPAATKFISGIFHELLTPINVILGFVQELTENIKNPSTEQKEAIDIINQNKVKLLELMNNVIEQNQSLNNFDDIRTESIRIINLIEEISSKVEDGNEISYGKISSSLEIVTDRLKFISLISLLFKIISSEKIYLSASRLNGDFIINLRDSFSSISEKLLYKLKDIFGDQNDEALVSSKYSLSLLDVQKSKSLLKTLGGKFTIVRVENKVDAGFIFPIELKQPKPDESRLKDTIHKETVTENEEIALVFQQSLIDLSQLSCLYIEDQTDSQTLFKLQMEGLKSIKFANSFEQALPLLIDNKFDFVVIDINLTGDYNGLDILKIIRRMPEYDDVPVIAVTAYLLSGDIDKFIRTGFSDAISKPIFREKLIISLEKLFTPQV